MTAELIDSRVREIVERTDILDVANTYAAVIDGRNWAALAPLFTDDANFEIVGFGGSSGPAGIVALVKAVVQPLDVTQHVNTNHLVTVRGDDAEHTAYFLAQHVKQGVPGGDQFLIGGRYEDRLRRTPDGWRFTNRLVTFIWTQGNPAVVS